MAPLVWYIVLPLAGLFLGWMIRWLYARFQLSSAERKSERVLQDAIKEAEAKKKEILVEAKDQIIRERNQQEREIRDRRIELQKYERRVLLKEENLDAKLSSIERIETNLKTRESTIAEKEAFLAGQEERYAAELERVSGFTAEEAKKLIIQNMEQEARRDAQVLINKIDQEAHRGEEGEGYRHYDDPAHRDGVDRRVDGVVGQPSFG